MKEKWKCKDERRIFKNTYSSGKCEDQKKILLSIMKEVTDDEHVHNDSSSKELPAELVENIIKSDSMTTTTTTTIDKLFADGGASMKAMRFLEIWEIMELPYCIKVRKRMLKLDGKKETFLGIYPSWHRKMICKSGKGQQRKL